VNIAFATRFAEEQRVEMDIAGGVKRAAARLRGEVGLITGRGVDLGTLPRVLADAYDDRPAVTPGEGPERTFREIEHEVARLAAAHDALGHRGTRVALAMANRIDVLLHVFALVRAGAVPLPVNPRLSREEFASVIAASEATVVLADGDVAARVGDEGRAPHGARWCWTGVGEPPAGAQGEAVEAWLAAHPDARLEPTGRVGAREVALLLATSGTTGKPKIAVLTSEGLLGVLGLLRVLPVGRTRGLRAGRDALLCALPLTHVMGLSTMLGALCAGVRAIHLERFDAAEVLARIERERPNVFVGVPTMYADLEAAGAATRDLSSVQLWVSAADVMPPERARRFQQYGALETVLGRRVGTAAFADVYGMVELSGPAALRLYPPSPRRAGPLPPISVVLPGFQVRVVDEAGRPLRWGATGELQIRGRGVLQRYEGAQGAGPNAEGWFATGDLARVWPGGIFTFVGRRRDRLKVGGFSVFPAEVETILRTHPGVADVALVGVPDERLGERPVALVVPKDQGFDTEAFLAWAAEHVAGYRRPREAKVVSALPRGAHGKIDRAAATRMAAG
jgi:acyl-CoA synthetase (AMP-forming)/AMP-acid ligase II